MEELTQTTADVRKEYVSPVVESLSIRVESGFAASPEREGIAPTADDKNFGPL